MRGVGRLAWIEAKLVLRDPLTLVFTIAFPLLMFLLLAEIFGNSTADRDEVVYRNQGAIDFYVPGYVALVAAAVGLVAVPVHVAAHRELGVLRRFRAGGMSARLVLSAELLVAVGLSAVGMALVWVLAALVYGNRQPASVPGVLLVALVVAVMFAALGLLMGAVVPTARGAQALGVILFFAMLLLSGTGPPPEVLTGPLRAASRVLPLTPAARLMQDVWLGLGWEWRQAAALAAVLAAAAVLAVRCFRWE